MEAGAGPEEPDGATAEHAVLVHIAMSDRWGSPMDRFRLWRLERRLEKAVERAGAGEFDGYVLGEGQMVFFVYGPDKDQLWRAVEPVLRTSPLRPAHVLLRGGGPDTDPERIDL